MLLIFCYIATAVFAIGFVYRGLSIKMMPMHLRWELAPVPHEAGKAHYGGSYLEEFEWWTKPREKSLLSEGLYMFKEIVFLKGVWEHNRPLWIFSFPFHFGLYLLTAMTGALLLAAFAFPPAERLALLLGTAGYILGAIGTVGLFLKRLLDPKLKPFATPASFFNLLVLAAVFVSGAYAVFTTSFTAEMTGFIKAFFSGNTGMAVSGAIAAHIAAGMFFLLYLPFSYMMHFLAKYFFYHEIRWNDEPMNPAMEEEVKQLLGQTVTWSAPHLGADGKKNWVDIATSDMPKKEETKNA
ncbi:MAG: respiratory nitrate reductase subunit gamma [Elusimicrobiota bacterium]